jgi:hypothetical protein
MGNFFNKLSQAAFDKQTERIQSQSDKERRDRQAYKFATYQGKDPVDGTDIVSVNGETTSGYKLISNASLDIGDRVSLRPNQGGLQRVDAKNNPPENPVADIPPDVAEYYFGINYMYFVGAAIEDYSLEQEIILEGDTITDLTIRAFIGDGEITYELIDNTFTFVWVTFGNFAIEYLRESQKKAVVFVTVLDAVNGSFIALIQSYAHLVCGVKGRDLIGFLDGDANTAFNNSRSLKSQVDVSLNSDNSFRSYMLLKIDITGGIAPSSVEFTDLEKLTAKFSRLPQFGLINFQGGIPPTTDLLTFTLKKNNKQKGKIVKKYDSLELKTLKSNQHLSYLIAINIFDFSDPDPAAPPIATLSAFGYYRYTDLDIDPYEFVDASGSDGDLSISGLAGAVAPLGIVRRIEVSLQFSTSGYWIDLFARYGLIDSERILVNNTYTISPDPETTEDLYIEDLSVGEGSVNFVLFGEDLNFTLQFKRETASTWLQV